MWSWNGTLLLALVGCGRIAFDSLGGDDGRTGDGGSGDGGSGDGNGGMVVPGDTCVTAGGRHPELRRRRHLPDHRQDRRLGHDVRPHAPI